MMMFCENCGTQQPDNARFCAACGAQITPPPAAETPVYTPPPPQQDFSPAAAPAPQDYSQIAPAPQQGFTPAAPPQQQGYTMTAAPPQEFAQPPQEYSMMTPEQQSMRTVTEQRPQVIGTPYTPPPKSPGKGRLLLFIGIPLLLIAGGLTAFFLLRDSNGGDTPPSPALASSSAQPTASANPIVTEPEITYSYLSEKPTAKIEYTAEEKIFPSLYRTLDSLVTLTCYSYGGECDVMVSVEVPGFTQVYKQQVHLTETITKMRIVPPLLTGDLNLKSEKAAQIVISVTESDTGKVLVQDSRNVTISSLYDMIWWTQEYGDINTDNILAWMTPESPKVLELKRDAIDYIEYISDGYMTALIGYQDYNFFDDYYDNTWVQAVALQGAMSDVAQVRYNNASFSITKDVQQRVMLPDEVLSSRSGICVETALTMASALQSAGMHVMLIFPPGHAQVAVEAWPGTGDYFLIETTILPMSMDYDGWNAVVQYLSKDEWWEYLGGYGWSSLGECYVLDCDLGQKLGIVPMSN